MISPDRLVDKVLPARTVQELFAELHVIPPQTLAPRSTHLALPSEIEYEVLSPAAYPLSYLPTRRENDILVGAGLGAGVVAGVGVLE